MYMRSPYYRLLLILCVYCTFPLPVKHFASFQLLRAKPGHRARTGVDNI